MSFLCLVDIANLFIELTAETLRVCMFYDAMHSSDVMEIINNLMVEITEVQ